MDFELSEDQQLLGRSARDFLAAAGLPGLLRELRSPEAGGHSATVWQAITELGWPGLALPEDVGGGGGTFLDLAALLEETGRALLPRTFSGTVAAALVIDRHGSEGQRAALLPDLVGGRRIVALAVDGRGGPGPDRRPSVEVTREGGRVHLSGGPVLVPHASVADWLLVVVRGAHGAAGAAGSMATAWVMVPADQPGVSRQVLRGFGNDGLGRVRFEDVTLGEDALLGCPGQGGADDLPGALEVVVALLAVEMAGGASAVLERTVAYVKERIQFDRPIGSFQAVQHAVADCAMAADAARYAAFQAVWELDRSGRAPVEVAIAKVAAGDAFKKATMAAHELHGGAGYVTDHDLHLYSERAQVDDLTFGTRDDYLALLASGSRSTP